MKRILSILLLSVTAATADAQVFEWRLSEASYSGTDPDGAGPATGQVSFKMQIHTTGATVPNVTQIATGFSYQSARAVVPAVPACVLTASTPANIIVSPAFTSAGFAYTSVLQCNAISPAIVTGGQSFDRRANGTVDNGSITIGPVWVDVFTVTLWTLQNTSPQGGYAIINSSEGGAPGEYTTYSISTFNPGTGDVNQYPANSLTYATPLSLSAAPLPVRFTNVGAECQFNKSTVITWSTVEEKNNSHFEMQKSSNGTDWVTIGRINAAVTEHSSERNYRFTDPEGGPALYRLKQDDRDGRTVYSATVRTTCEGRNTYVTLYPVPARDILNLVIGSDKAAKTNLQLFDNKGRLVLNRSVSVAVGRNSFLIPVHNLAAGEYVLLSSGQGIEINKRFTVIR